jgi:hypothetical protein
MRPQNGGVESCHSLEIQHFSKIASENVVKIPLICQREAFVNFERNALGCRGCDT